MFVTPSLIISADGARENNQYFIDEPGSGEIGQFDLKQLEEKDHEALVPIIRDYLLNTTEPPIAMAMLGYAAYSIIEPFLLYMLHQNRFALFISGLSGRGKSHVAGHFYHLFGDFRNVPSWTSAGNSIVKMGNYINGGLLVIDDFKNENVKEDEALRVFQNYADRNGRARLDRNAALRKTEEMRSGFMATGEHSLTNQASTVARIVNLEMTAMITEEQKQINAQVVRAYRLLPGFFPLFIQQIICADWNTLSRQCELDIKSFEDAIGSKPNSTTVAANHGILLFSTRLVLEYAFGDRAVANEKVELVRQYLLERINVTLEDVGSLQSHEKFIQKLRNMFSRGEVAFKQTDGYGNYVVDVTDNSKAVIIGQINRNKVVHLDLPNAYDLVCQSSRRMGKDFTYPLKDLKRDLVQSGIIGEESESVKVSGRSKRLYRMSKNVFEDIEEPVVPEAA